jgi:hypothetical protein
MTALRKVIMSACESWNVTEIGNIFTCVLAMYLEHFRVQSNVVQNIATILRSLRITVHKDEILRSGRKTHSLIEGESADGASF